MRKLLHSVGRAFAYSLILLTALFIIYPILFTFVTSIKSTKEYFLNPVGFAVNAPTLGNYINILSNFNFFPKLLNTAIVVFISMVLIFLFAVPSAYYLCNIQRAMVKRAAFIFCFLFMFIPEEVLILPEYNMMSALGLVNNYLSVIILFFTSSLPEVIFLFTIYFGLIPEEIRNAAHLDGVDELSYLTKIVVPISISPIIVVMITTAISLWNSFLIPMVLLYEEDCKLLLPSLSGLITKHSPDPTYQMAGVFLSLIPLIIVYIIHRKQIFESSIGGAIR